MGNLRIAYVVNNAAFFVSHRLPLAISMINQGFEVILITGRAGSLEMEKIAINSLTINRIQHRVTISSSSGLNPVVEFISLLQLIWFLLRFKPNIVHCASPKGILYGGFAARICGVSGLVIAISGKGYAFTKSINKDFFREAVGRIYKALYSLSFRHPNVRVITQNHDDYYDLVSSGNVLPSNVKLIHGSGVDLTLFKNINLDDKKNIVLLPARMLKDKGVNEFVMAVKKIQHQVEGWRFILAGVANYDNPSAITKEALTEWQLQGYVEWLGYVEDMVPLYTEAAIVCLPSYREGMPKALLEAAAAGCAVVTTDVVGCREAILPGVTGDLVPVCNSSNLAEVLLSLIKDDDRRRFYGLNGRKRAEILYSVDSVVFQVRQLYEEILSE